MLDIKIFGEKLKEHRLNLGLTQQTVADGIGVSAQAVSKWENGECLPDCFNLKELCDLYHISIDVLMDTDSGRDISAVANKIEQIADEFIWANQKRDKPNVHHDLGSDLWDMWKGIFFIEVGNKQFQAQDKAAGNLRVCSEYGMKIWDDDGVVCVVQSALREKLNRVTERELDLLLEMCSPEGFRLLSCLDSNVPLSKADLIEKSGIELSVLNDLLLKFIENQVVEYVLGGNRQNTGYKLCARYGIAASMVLAAAFILAKPNFTSSEYISY